jgi:hypothetical protein
MRMPRPSSPSVLARKRALAQRGRVLADHLAVVHEAARAQHDAALRAVVARLARGRRVHADHAAVLVDDQALA